MVVWVKLSVKPVRLVAYPFPTHNVVQPLRIRVIAPFAQGARTQDREFARRLRTFTRHDHPAHFVGRPAEPGGAFGVTRRSPPAARASQGVNNGVNK